LYKYKINHLYAYFESFILNIRNEFQENRNSIHKARNELKVISHQNEEVVVKSFKIPNFPRRLFYTLFRDSKAKKSYDYSVKIGTFTPEPIAYIEFYNSGLLSDSYFIAKKFFYDFTIREVLTNQDFDNRDDIFVAFAIFTFHLHEEGILHQDYSPGNILIAKHNGHYQFKVVDINRMTFKTLSLDERLKNFAKLWIDDKDLKTVIAKYAALIHEDEGKCYEIAVKYSHALKKKINMKKRLKGIEVVD